MIYIVNFGSSKTAAIADCVAQLGYASAIVEDDAPEQIDPALATGIILGGAPILLTEIDYDSYIKRYSFLKTVNVPVLGICFGHQLIGLLYGAAVYKGVAVRSVTEITVMNAATLLNGFEPAFMMQEDHTEGITLPPDFIVLAGSASYAVETMKHTERDVYGVQFHPEASGANGMRLFTNFCSLLKK